MTEFVVHGTTTYDGIEFPFQWSGTAEDESEAMANAILGQTRGDLCLEFGNERVMGASDDEAVIAEFRSSYQGERVIDHLFADASAIHEIDSIDSVEKVKIDLAGEVKIAIADIVEYLKAATEALEALL